VLLLSTAWCIPHLGVSYADLNSSSIGAIACNTNSGSSSRNNNNGSNSNSSCGSIVLLPHYHGRLQSGYHSRLLTAAFRASTAESWDISPASVTCQSEAVHHELWRPWSTNRGAHRGVLHHGLAVPTTPRGMRSPQGKKC
jgi:hypothetical protein